MDYYWFEGGKPSLDIVLGQFNIMLALLFIFYLIRLEGEGKKGRKWHEGINVWFYGDTL